MKLVYLILISLFLLGCAHDKSTSKLDVDALNVSVGVKIIEGYVIQTYACPPCAENGYCEPCMPNHLIVSSENKTFYSYLDLLETDERILTNNVSLFVIGESYIFFVNESTNELIRYQ